MGEMKNKNPKQQIIKDAALKIKTLRCIIPVFVLSTSGVSVTQTNRYSMNPGLQKWLVGTRFLPHMAIKCPSKSRDPAKSMKIYSYRVLFVKDLPCLTANGSASLDSSAIS
jgi:hypothetical protein